MDIISSCSDYLHKDNSGIWFANETDTISYPEDGNEKSFEIEESSFWFEHRNKCIIEAIKLHQTKDIPFFDVGGGNGFVSKAIQNEGFEVALVEPGISGIRNAQKRGVKNLLCSTFQNAQIKQNSIGSAGLFDVLEHVKDDSCFLGQLNKQLVSGGLLYLTVPAYRFLWSHDDVIAGHYRRYNMGELKKVVERSGYEVVYSTYIFKFLTLPIFIMKKIPELLGIKTNNMAGHEKQNPFINNLISRLLEGEINAISNKKSIKFGGTCLMVARKKRD